MRRRTFDALMASAGLVLALVLSAAGGLMLWAHNFVDHQVTTQLSAQKIYFPEKGSDSLNVPQVKPYLEQYAGQRLTTGPQAKAYADHYIAVHVSEMTGGKSYAQVSADSMAHPDNQKLAGLKQTVFQGETLRGLLLNAYAFATIGTIALYGAIASFVGAVLMLVLSLLGLGHLRRTPATAEIKLGTRHASPVAV
jgi:hypothetical protein